MISQIQKDAHVRRDWRTLPVNDLRQLRRRLIAKHGSLGAARIALRLNTASALGDVLANRANHPAYIVAIQQDQELSNDHVLHLWPLLRQWPRDSRRAI